MDNNDEVLSIPDNPVELLREILKVFQEADWHLGDFPAKRNEITTLTFPAALIERIIFAFEFEKILETEQYIKVRARLLGVDGHERALSSELLSEDVTHVLSRHELGITDAFEDSDRVVRRQLARVKAASVGYSDREMGVMATLNTIEDILFEALILKGHKKFGRP